MRYDKKKNRVLVDKKYVAYNYMGYTLLGGIPFTFLAITQDLFYFRNDTVSVTAWGIVGLGVVGITAWSKVKEVIKNYNTYLGSIGNRAKVPIFFGGLSLALLITYISIELILSVTLSFVASGLISLPIFNAYDREFAKAIALTKELEKEENNGIKEELMKLKATV